MKPFLFSVNIVFAMICIILFLLAGADPRTFWLFSIASILIPILFALNILFILFWFLFHWRYIWLPIVTLFCAYPHFSKMLQFNEDVRSTKCLQQSFYVMSYNIYGLKNIKTSSESIRENNKAKFISFLRKYEPDILCVQEDNFYADEIINNTGLYNYFHYEPSHATAIYSKHPIMDKGNVDFGKVTTSCVWADILVNGKKIRFYSAHLSSNQVSRDVEKMTDEKDENNKEKLGIVKRMFQNYRTSSSERAEQIEKIIEHITSINFPYVIAGDFNDTPFSYAYELMTKKCSDSFVECGEGIGSTYNGALPGLRIDYVFGSRALTSFCSHRVLQSTFSDHNPVFVKVYSKI